MGKADPEFDAGCREAEEIYKDKLEAEADRRAVEGVGRLKFNRAGFPLMDPATGKPYEERLYSDALLMFRLKRLDPGYKDRVDVNRNPK
jgi:hypothetical protein